MTLIEERAVFSLWCIVSSPLVLGFDVADDAVVEKYWPIVTNTDALGVSSAWAGEAGRLLKISEPHDPGNVYNHIAFDGTSCEVHHQNDFPAWMVYSKAVDTSGSIAVLAIRLGHSNTTISVSLQELVAANAGPNSTTTFEGTNVWDAAAPVVRVTADAPWTPEIDYHDSAFIIFKPASSV